MAPEWMLCEDRALYVSDLGHLDQYGSYVDTLWEKGVVYFLRDMLCREIHRRRERGDTESQLASLVRELHTLNSDILKWEQNGGRVTG